MHFAPVLLLSLTSTSVATQALSLLDALRHANASIFAQQIQSNANISALYYSKDVQTVFAPVDSSSLARIRVRAPADQTDLGIQSAQGLTGFNVINSQPGAAIATNSRSVKLNGDNRQNVVSHGTGNSANNKKRSVFPRQNVNNATVQRVKISSGLGNNVSIIQGDIPYDGGIIHLVDGFFTLPKALSATSSQTNNTQFASRLSRSNLTNLLDNTPSITAFIPSDAAFAIAGNSSQTLSQIGSQLLGHVLVDQVLYLPRLVDGATYQTQAGTTIIISIRGGRYFVNGVLIVQSDLILENGVAHILNKVLPGTSPPITASPPITGSSSSTFNLAIPTILSIVTALVALRAFIA